MNGFPRSMSRLVDEFCKMPGIGMRSAQRLAFHVLRSSREDVDALVRRIIEVKESVRFCRECNNLSDKETCSICSDPSRDRSRICVVEGPSGVLSIEKTGIYKGLYHVLLGDLSPIDGVGPEEIKIDDLLRRLKKGGTAEVVIATDFTTEGETTALYLSEVMKPFKVKVARLARGVPAGAILEYADVATLQRAFEERKGV